VSSKVSYRVSVGLMALSVIFSCIGLFEVVVNQQPAVFELFTWIKSGTFNSSWALKFDSLTLLIIVVVTIISTLIHFYSLDYFGAETQNNRLFAGLSLLTFGMLVLVASDNLLQMYFGWEMVGFASCFLISLKNIQGQKNKSVSKVFLIDRLGNSFILVAIVGLYLIYDSVLFDDIFQAASTPLDTGFRIFSLEINAIKTVAIFLVLGAMVKSAQLGFHVWLPDATQSAIPAVGLIHGATVILAGVYLIVRFSAVIENAPDTLIFLTVIGALTAFFGAAIACCQDDMRNVISYSTCSQLGYVFFACGVSAYSLAIFHLVVHAFTSTLLILGIGSVIRATSGENNIKKTGGLRKKIPVTYWVMMIGALILAGFPFLSGYYARGLIIDAAFSYGSLSGDFAYYIGALVIAMTAFYSFRLVFIIFYGDCKACEGVQVSIKESPVTMLIPMTILVFFALFVGEITYNSVVGEDALVFWNDAVLVTGGGIVSKTTTGSSIWITLLPTVMFVFGAGAALLLFILKPNLAAALSRKCKPIYLFFTNECYVTELYTLFIAKPIFYIRMIFEGGIKNLPSGDLSSYHVIKKLRFTQHYSFVIIVGSVVLILLSIYSANG
jgi:NADH-quinone oxidoreductase subunit L